ncbi:MAG TPA: polysialyltransferase family glycosyltransferase, partial [Polyangiales bacterium]|nr:polysialyltransferase family glycosyltransferase [Polyangiales bacterium]
WLRPAAFLLGRRFGMAWRDPRIGRDRVEHALLLTGTLQAPREAHGGTLHRVAKEHVQSAIARARPAFTEALDGPYFLIVGQYYATLRQMSRSEELGRYAAAAEEATRRGFTPVWRGHIRNDDRYYDELKQRCPSLRNFSELVDDPSYPLELYDSLFDARCAGAASFSSSALFYLRELYGVATYTLLDAGMVQRMNYPHRDGCGLALSQLPHLLPAA